jgi:hypothetical protein
MSRLLRVLAPPSLRASVFCRLPLRLQDPLLWDRLRRDLEEGRP